MNIREKTCCFTGHRDLPEEIWDNIEIILFDEVGDALINGYNCFMTGLAEGADQIFAEVVLTERRRRPDIKLVAVISHAGRLKAKDPEFQRLLKLCDEVRVLSDRYDKGVYYRRNKYMVDNSSLVLAAYDGRPSGGTCYTVKYAEKQGVWVREIPVKPLLTDDDEDILFEEKKKIVDRIKVEE